LSFQPFAVQCQTCGSRLRVTDPAIVGTIAACPKCNSMVKIDPQGGQVAVGRSNVDSQAITEEGIDVDDGSTDSGAGSGADTGADTGDGQRFSGSQAIDGDGAESVAPADPSQWQSDRTRRSRQVALVVTLSLAGLCGGVAIFSWFVHSWRQRSATAVTAAESPVADPTDVTPPIDATADASTDTASESAEPRTAQDTENQSPPSATLDTPPDSSDQQDQVVKGPDSAPPIPSDLIPQSPLAPSAVDTPDASPDDTGGMQDLPPELAKFLDVLPFQGAAEAPTLEAPPSVDDVKIDDAAEDDVDPLNPPKPKPLNIKADLGIRLAFDSRDAKGYRLVDLMSLIGQITGVPIQVDWVSFDLAGSDIDARVAIPQGWRSAHELLQLVASDLEAEIREEQTLVTLTPSDASFDQTMTELADLDDFGDGKASAALVLEDFLRADANEKDVDLAQLGKPREAQQLAALAIESMRRIRGVAPKVADERLRHWARSSENEQVEWPVLAQGDPGPQLDAPVTLAELLRKSAKRNQAICVVNWYDANRKGAAPNRLVFPKVDVDAGTTLDRTLGPFGIQVRSVDATHWWVGSEATYDRLPVVVWTQPLGDGRDAFSRRIDAIMAGVPRDRFRMTIDQQTGRALLLLPRFIVRQLPKISPAIAAK
jgi:hypothetical protein